MDRRNFLTAAGAVGFMIVKPEAVRGTQANSAVRLGVIGCGGRGTQVGGGFVSNADARVVALADVFQDQLDAAKARFEKTGTVIETAQVFRGPKAYQELVNSKDVDMVLITSPPYFHPEHLEAAVAAGKHVYVEKPVAVDVPGCRRVLAAGTRAEGKLSLDVGFQLRMAPPFVELVQRVHDGAIGEIVCGEAHYNAAFINLRDFPEASADVRQLRHWVHDRVLSGDILVEQNIHSIDICNWILKEHPLRAVGTGGRRGRTEEGTAWSHFVLTYFYPNDVHVGFSSTQFANKVTSDVNERFFGSGGKCQTPYTGPVRIEGEQAWAWQGKSNNNIDTAEAEKEKAFIESIVSGRFHNQAAQAVDSTLTCIMGRMAAYSGQTVTWEETLKSEETFDPKIDLEEL